MKGSIFTTFCQVLALLYVKLYTITYVNTYKKTQNDKNNPYCRLPYCIILLCKGYVQSPIG